MGLRAGRLGGCHRLKNAQGVVELTQSIALPGFADLLIRSRHRSLAPAGVEQQNQQDACEPEKAREDRKKTRAHSGILLHQRMSKLSSANCAEQLGLQELPASGRRGFDAHEIDAMPRGVKFFTDPESFSAQNVQHALLIPQWQP